MKILVTGGSGKLANKLAELDSQSFITPNKTELNLLDTNSIKEFYEKNKEIEGIIFNASINDGSSLNEDSHWSDVNTQNKLIDVFILNHISVGLLVHLYKQNLKFIIGLSTGMINHQEKNNCCPIYIMGKEILKNTIERFSYTEHLKHIKMFNLNPGPMQSEEEYKNHSVRLQNIISNIDSVNQGSFEWIGDKKFDYEN